MWKRLYNLFESLLSRFVKNDTKETWTLLEMRRKANLENLEDLKKLRLKNF